MADKATSSLSASVFLDEIKASMSGSLSYEPAVAIAASSGEGWVFSDGTVNSTSSDLLTTANDYMGGISNVDTDDKIMWIAVKNLSTTSTDGICLSLDAGTAAYTLVDGIFIGAGEMVVLKSPYCTVADLHAASVTMDGTYGYPSAAHTGAVACHVAAILKNVD
jgi:hypothetical protein